MKNRIMKNLWLKLLALVVAFIVWLVIINITDPTISRQFTDIPVDILNENVITSANQVYEVESGKTVDVTVKGKRSFIEELAEEDFYASADLSKLSTVNTAGIQVKLNKTTKDNVELDWNNEVLRVSLEKRDSKQFKSALSAGFTLCVGREAVDGFGEDARAGCLAHSTRTAKQICLSQTSGLNRILQRGCQILLTDYAAESGRAVFPRTDYVITHVFYRKIYAAPARITLRRSLNHKFNKKMSNHNNNSPIALQRKNEDRRKLWRKAIYTRAPETAAPLRSWVAKG